jgi:hypothetical protein
MAIHTQLLSQNLTGYSNRRLFRRLRTKHCQKLQGAIGKRDWDAVNQLFDERAFSHGDTLFAFHRVMKGHGDQNYCEHAASASSALLVWALHHKPPVKVVERLLQLFPICVLQPDHHGRFPLHEACRAGASSELIQLLADQYPRAVSRQDCDGRLPLHYAVASSISKFMEEEGDGIRVLQILLLASPCSILLPDTTFRAETPVDITYRLEHQRWSKLHPLKKRSSNTPQPQDMPLYHLLHAVAEYVVKPQMTKRAPVEKIDEATVEDDAMEEDTCSDSQTDCPIISSSMYLMDTSCPLVQLTTDLNLSPSSKESSSSQHLSYEGTRSFVGALKKISSSRWIRPAPRRTIKKQSQYNAAA